MSICLKHRLEYVALRSSLGLLRILPTSVALWLAWLLAFITHFIFGLRRREALRRIGTIFKESHTHSERKRIAWLSWRNLFFNAVDLIKNPELKTRTEPEQDPLSRTLHEPIQKVINESPAGAVLTTLHFGNWERLPALCACAELPLISIARRQKNRLTDAYLHQLRAQKHTAILAHDDPRLYRKIMQHLREGKLLGILPDIRNDAAENTVPFLGQPAALGAGCARFASATQAPILPVLLKRTGWKKLEIQLFEPILLDPTADKKGIKSA